MIVRAEDPLLLDCLEGFAHNVSYLPKIAGGQRWIGQSRGFGGLYITLIARIIFGLYRYPGFGERCFQQDISKHDFLRNFGLHLKKRQIGRACGVAASTVVDYIQRAEGAGISWPLPEDIDEVSDTALEAMINEGRVRPNPARRPLPAMEEIHRELRKKGVTLQLLWIEYKERFPEGYQHSQFCEYYSRWAKTLEVSMRQEHNAGEKMFVDFAGKGIPITNPSTGEIIDAQIFVAVLGASKYTYAEALPSQALPFWIRAHRKR